jgi:hypothetical protein
VGTYGRLWLVRCGLWILPFAWWRKKILAQDIPPVQGAPSSAYVDSGPLKRAVWSVISGSRFVPRATCLTQALTLRWRLQQLGIGSQLRIGVMREEGIFKAHAWLEVDGTTVIGGREEGKFSKLV